jgi:hypothetical protein
MVKVAVPNTFSTIYNKCDGDKCLMKMIKIPGEPGKKIKVDVLTLNMFSMSENATGTSWVTAECDGTVTEISRWTENSTASTPKSATPEYSGSIGKDVTLQWRLLTSNAAIRVKIKDITYTYTLIEDTVNVPQYLVVVECETQEEADALVANLVDQGATVYTRKAN